jgi:hypothetical protein
VTTRKFRISVELDEETVRCLGVVQKEFGIKPAESVRRALTMYFSKPIPKGGRR